tara:strand:- start:1245 stop:1532 length:288 start_codon:yes stop_codon:yes gene_type:complete
VEAVEKAVEKVAKKVSVMKMLVENPVARMNEEADARPWSWVRGYDECKRMRVGGGKRKSKKVKKSKRRRRGKKQIKKTKKYKKRSTKKTNKKTKK